MRSRLKFLLAAVLLVIASVTGVTAAIAAGGDITVRIGTHNVLRGAADIHDFADVIGWQEVNDAAARQKLRDSLPGYAHYFPEEEPARAIPISWRKDRFTLLSSGTRLTHEGEAGVTPNRYLNWVKLEHPNTGKRFFVINTHFISGAWNKHPERQQRWLIHADKLRELIRDLSDWGPNAPITVVGDFNRHEAIPLPRGVEWVPVAGISAVPFDQIHTQKQQLKSFTKVELLPMWGSDHHAYRFAATF